MQISHPLSESGDAIRPGDLVRVRRARWRIVHIRPCDGCRIVTLSGLTPPHLGVERRVILPFDIVEAADRVSRPRFVRGVTWRRACRALIAADGPPGSLRAARSARIELFPHQLEPDLLCLRPEADPLHRRLRRRHQVHQLGGQAKLARHHRGELQKSDGGREWSPDHLALSAKWEPAARSEIQLQAGLV